MLAGSQNEYARLRRVLVKHPRDAFVDERCIDAQWRGLGYTRRPDLAKACAEFEAFAEVLREAGACVERLPRDPRTGLDSLYVRDAAVVCSHGVVLARMGKHARGGEPAALGDALAPLGVPVHGAIGAGRLEGGDMVWLGERTLAVGHGYRTDAEGISQLGELLADCAGRLIVVPLPHWRGPGDVFHLMSIISPLDADLALVHAPLMPVPFLEALRELGIGLVEIAAEEFATQAANVLALAPRRCLMLEGNPLTRTRLERAGVEVLTYRGEHISLAGGGGPTCLTRPLERG